MTRFEAIIPVKWLADAKQRLGDVIDEPARIGLMSEMLANVLRALAGAETVSERFVVTPDPSVVELARACGAQALPDPGQGLNAALQDAVDRRLSAGADSLAIFQGDLPWLTATAVDDVLGLMQKSQSAALVSDQHERGTSALAWRGPPHPPVFAFGANSFSRHAEILRSAGLTLMTRGPSRPFHDLDDADDLAAKKAAEGVVCGG